MSANRIVYADGRVKRRLGSTGVDWITSDMGLSSWNDGRGRDVGVRLPRRRRRGDLEPDEAVDDVGQRAQQVEEAEREVRRGGDPEHAGDVGTTGVPRHQDRGDGAGVLHRAGEDLWGQPAPFELLAEGARGQHVGDVL